MALIASRFAGLIALAAVYAVACAASHWFGFPLTGDETHFWSSTLEWFAGSSLPSASALRQYTEVSTPLPFIVWGMLQYWLHQGVWLARALNLALSFAVAALIAWPSPGSDTFRRSVAAAGLLLCPYYLFVSTHAYTDVFAIFFALFGLREYRRAHHGTAAILFALAIASRQYAVAFPLAIAAHEIAPRHARASPAPLIAALAAAGTLGGWMLFFGGTAPPHAFAVHGVVFRATALLPRNALYLLACTGVYFAIPAWALRLTTTRIGDIGRMPAVLVAAALLALFVRFPPLGNAGVLTEQMGLLDRAAHGAGLPDPARMSLFYLLAVAAIAAVWRQPFAAWLLALNALVTVKGFLAWDKHALPLVAALWFLASRVQPCDSKDTERWPSGRWRRS